MQPASFPGTSRAARLAGVLVPLLALASVACDQLPSRAPDESTVAPASTPTSSVSPPPESPDPDGPVRSSDDRPVAPSPTPPRPGQDPGIVLSEPDCKTYPEGTPLGPRRFQYVRSSPWENTDFDRRCVPFIEFASGGVGKDGIRSIDNPVFETLPAAEDWLEEDAPLLVVEYDGIARAYPLRILIWHEIVNDAIGDFPFVVTYCPLCQTALVFERRINGGVYDFGTTGLLRGSDLVMYDRQTESWWQQVTGQAIVGEMSGTKLKAIPAFHLPWDEFKNEFPKGMVLSVRTGYERPYGTTPYIYYLQDQGPDPNIWGTGGTDGRLPTMEMVAGISIGGVHVAFPFTALERERIVTHNVGDEPVVVTFDPAATSVLSEENLAEARAIGSTNAFHATLDGETLLFEMRQGEVYDTNTGSRWNGIGQAVEGPLQGSRLEPVPYSESLWFAWAVFHPETTIYGM